jgi:hypothetical protein
MPVTEPAYYINPFSLSSLSCSSLCNTQYYSDSQIKQLDFEQILLSSLGWESYTSIVYLHQQLQSHFNLHLILSPTLSLNYLTTLDLHLEDTTHTHLVILIHHQSFCSRTESHSSRIKWSETHSSSDPTQSSTLCHLREPHLSCSLHNDHQSIQPLVGTDVFLSLVCLKGPRCWWQRWCMAMSWTMDSSEVGRGVDWGQFCCR